MFSNDQTHALRAPLDKAKVKTREQAGRELSYIEGWHAIDEANRIFGFDGWTRETVYLKEVCRIEGVNKYGKPQYKVGYEAKVRVTVGNVVREGTGYGQGTMGDLYDAMESAGKEAETDAMKRALMTFGNPFGLALYDKTQANVATLPPKAKPSADDYMALARGALFLAKSVEDIVSWWKAEAASRQQHGISEGTAEYAELVELCAQQKTRITKAA